MSWLTEWQLTRKVMIAITATSGLALLLAGGVFVANDSLQLRKSLRREIITTGKVVEPESAAALARGDREAANRILQALDSDDHILAASLYLPGSAVPLASYHRVGLGTGALPLIPLPGLYDEDKSILLVQNLVFGGQTVGTLRLRGDTSDLLPLMERDFGMAILVSLMCVLIALALTARLRKLIALPLVHLAEMARAMPGGSAGKSENEVHILTDAFDMMQSRAEAREGELRDCRARLEYEMAELAATRESLDSERAEADSLAEAAVRIKSEFLANLSYEIRTSTNAVIGMAQLALETNLSPEQRTCIASVRASAESLLNVVHNISEFSRIEAGGLLLRPQGIGIWPTLYKGMQTLSPAARSKGLSLLLNVHKDVPPTVLGDGARFRQVVVHLIDNAIRFADAGSVRVDASSVFHSESVVGLHFQVADTGRGLTKDHFARALEPFGHEHHPQTQLNGGAGLGLAISNRLVAMMGGSLWMESEPNAGTTIHFTATYETRPENGAARHLGDLRGVKVLVADGNPVTRRILEQLLSGWEMKPAMAASASQAIGLVRSAVAAGSPFGMALVDKEMLGTDGSGLAAQLRGRPELDHTMITVLSSIDTVSVTDFTRDCSSSSYLVKPVTPSTLLKALSESLHAGKASREEIAQ